MKKGLALILTLAVVAMLVPVGIVSLTASAAVENSYADIVNIYRDSISGSTTPSSDSKILSCEVVDGKITVKVQLAQWDYIQFAQPVTDIIHSYDVADYDTLQVNLGEHDIGETLPNPNGDTTNTYWDAYRNAHFFVSLTDNPDYTVRAVDAYWQIKGGSMFSGNAAGWENAVFAAAGRLPAYPLSGSVGYFSRNGSGLFQTRGVAFPFNFETDKDGYLMMDSVNDVANKFCNVGADEAEKKANYDKHVTVKDIDDMHHSHGNGTDAECYDYSYQPAANTALYPRITSVRPGVNVYSICLNSKDIDGPIDPSEYVNIHRDGISGSTTPSSDSKILNCKVEDGKITVKVQLAQWDYIQFAKPVTDIIHSYDVADYDTLQVNLGEHDIGETLPNPNGDTTNTYWDAYRNAHFFVSLTDNPDYTVRAVDAYWQIKGGSMFSGNTTGWENAVFAAAGRLPGYPLTGSVGYFSRNGSGLFQTRGVAFPFNFETDKDGYLMMDSVNDVANKFCNVGADEAEKKANYDKHVTVKDIDDMHHSHGNGTDAECYDYSYQPAANTALYPRITSVRAGVNVYSICLNSADIKLEDDEPEIKAVLNYADGSTEDILADEDGIVDISGKVDAKSGAAFMGWYTDEELTVPFDATQALEESINLYPAFATVGTVSVNANDEFTNDTRGFGLLGAQIRTTDNSLRFVARINKSFVAEIEKNGEIVEFGIALVSERYFVEGGGGYNNGAPEDMQIGDGSATVVNKHTVANVKATKLYNDFEDYYRYTAVITGLNSTTQKSARFCARAYITYEDVNGVQHTYYATEADNENGDNNYKTGYGAYWKSFDQAMADLQASKDNDTEVEGDENI